MPTQTTQKNSGEKTRKAEWKRVRLGEVCDFSYGFTASAENKDTGVKLIRITDIVPQLIDWNNVPFCKIEENKLNQFLLKKGDIVVARTGATAGYAKLFRKDPPINSVFASYLIRIKPKTQDLDNFFLGSLIESDIFKSFVVQNAGGAAQPHANAPVLKEFEFLLPPLSEQKKIAEVLSAYDDLIEVNQKKIKTLETLAQTLYKEWFIKPVKDGLPNGWEVKKIGDRFVTVLGGTPSRAVDSYWQNGTISWINSGKINEFRVFDQSEFITEEAVNKSATKMMPKRTTLVAITGATLGQFSLTEIECCANQSVVGIYDKENIYNEYIYLKISEIIKDLVAKSTGSAQPHINKDDVNNTEIIIPDLQTIKEFNQIILPIFNDISNLVFQNQNLQKTRDILIPQLVGGRVEVR